MPDKNRPNYNFIKKETVYNDVINAVNETLNTMGYNNRGVDNSNEKKPRYITHNEVNYVLRQVYRKLFRPDKPLYNNQRSKINYNDVEVLNELANVFIDLCSTFNKSLGLISFGYLTGIDHETMRQWLYNDGTANPARLAVLKRIQTEHKAAHIALLNEAPVGALAVANNDRETGLEWAKQNAQLTVEKQVFILPSERLNKLKLDAPQE